MRGLVFVVGSRFFSILFCFFFCVVFAFAYIVDLNTVDMCLRTIPLAATNPFAVTSPRERPWEDVTRRMTRRSLL